MKASLIVPCWNCARTLPRFIASVKAQTHGDFETIFVDDGSTDATAELLAEAVASADPRRPMVALSRAHAGVSATRNAGLEVARGEYVFFADPDDLMDPEMLSKGVEAMERDAADYCVFPHRERREGESGFQLRPLKGTCRHGSNAEILREHFPRMFGYSMDQVRAWYASGGSLHAQRMHGGVWCCVYRRELIEAHRVRFDERIELYEDAMFNCAYMLHANRMTCVDEPLYDYILGPQGAIARLRRSERELANKLELLRARRELDAAAGGRLEPLYAASCVFSALEMLQLVFTFRAPFLKGLLLVRAYLAEPVVRRAIDGFPLSWRHPVLALGVVLLRLLPEPKAASAR